METCSPLLLYKNIIVLGLSEFLELIFNKFFKIKVNIVVQKYFYKSDYNCSKHNAKLFFFYIMEKDFKILPVQLHLFMFGWPWFEPECMPGQLGQNDTIGIWKIHNYKVSGNE